MQQLDTAPKPTSTNGAPPPAIAPSEEFDRLPVNVLRESPTNPRKTFDAKKLAELAASVKEHGIVEPLVTRPLADGSYEVIAGARRLRACKMAELALVPCIIRHRLTDKQVLEIQTIENVQREDVHELEEANGYKLLIDQAGYTVESIAEKIGKTVSYVYQRLKLAELSKQAQDKFWQGEITAGHAVQIARLQPADQKAAIDVCTGFQSMSVRELGDWIKREIHRNLTAAPFDAKSVDLVAAAGACTACPKRSGTALYADIREKDQCMDPGCFQRKIEAHIERSLRSAKPILRLSSSYNDAPEGVLPTQRYIQVANGVKKCDSTQAGIIVHGYRDLGTRVSVCADKHCKVHRPGGSSQATDYQRQQKEREAKARVENRARQVLLDHILEKVPAILTLEDLRVVAGGMWDRLWHEHQRQFLTRRKLLDKSTGPDMDRAAKKLIASLDAKGLLTPAILVAFSIAHG